MTKNALTGLFMGLSVSRGDDCRITQRFLPLCRDRSLIKRETSLNLDPEVSILGRVLHLKGLPHVNLYMARRGKGEYVLLRFSFVQLLWVVVLAAGLLVFGSDRAEADTALASWYGPDFHGLPTANGEHFDAHGNTVAHKTLPLGTELLVSYGGNTAQVVVNDRGPYIGTRDLDLSQGVAQQLGLTEVGVDYVEVIYLGSQAGGDSLGMDVSPQQTNAVPMASIGGSYVVKPGDSLSGIAAQLGTTTDHLTGKNGISNPNLVYGGQSLLL